MGLYKTFSFDRTAVIRPARLNLSKMAPINLGNGFTESLSSYFNRLANVHHVSPNQLFTELISKTQSYSQDQLKPHARLEISSHYSSILNDAIKRHSTVDCNFLRLTICNWTNAFSVRAFGPLTEHYKWCPLCLVDDAEEHGSQYIRLLWSIEVVSVCPRHKIALVSKCPECDNPQRFHVSSSVIGFCSHCGFEFADSSKTTTRSSIKISEKERWHSDAVFHLIAYTRDETELDAEDIRKVIGNFVEIKWRGSVRAAEKSLRLCQGTLQGWLTRRHRPVFSKLVDLAYRLDLPLEAFFDKNFPIDYQQVKSTRMLQIRKGPYISQPEINHISERIKQVRESGSRFSTLAEVAAYVGITRGILSSRFPQEAKALLADTRKERARKARERDNKRADRIIRRANELINEGVYPGDRQILKDPDILASHLRYPHIKSALRRVQAEFKASRNITGHRSLLKYTKKP